MNVAQAEREESERAHQAALTEIEKAGTQEQMTDWATAKKFIEENPIFAKTYHISYNESGTPSYTPEVPDVNLTPPTLTPVDFSSVGRRDGAGPSAAEGVIAAPVVVQGPAQPAAPAPKGEVVIENPIVNSPKDDAATMMRAARQRLRGVATEVSIG